MRQKQRRQTKTAADKREDLRRDILAVSRASRSGQVGLFPEQFKLLGVSPGALFAGVKLVEYRE